jgi:hypothetical protein
MQDEVFNSVTGREVQKFFDGYISDKDRLKAVTAIQREVVNYMILTTPIELYGKTVTIGEFVKALLVAVEKSPAKQLKSIQKKIKEGKVNSFYGIQELFSTIAGDGKRKTNNIRILNKQKDVEYSDTITDSWKEAENSSDQEISTFIRNLYLLALVQSGVNQSRISISQYLPSDFMKTIALQIIEKLKEGKIDFSRFRPLFYANKWNDKNFTKKLSYKQVTYQDYDDPEIRYSLISHRKELGIKADTFSPGYAIISKDENGNVNSVKITGYYLPHYQLSYTSLDINPKTGQKYTKQQADQAKKQGIDPYVTKIYQRVELNGSPVLVRNEKYYNFVYREVTKKGDGQYALEYADKSEIHTNLDPQSDSEIIAKFDEMNVTYTTVDEFKRSFSNPNEQSPFTQEAEDLTVKQLTQPTTPVVTPTVTPIEQFVDLGKFEKLSKLEGTKADVQMRTLSDGIIIESTEANSSSETSVKTILEKTKKDNTEFNVSAQLSTRGITKAVTPLAKTVNPVIMLARNYSLRNTSLTEDTKKAIDGGIKMNAKFIFGNSSTDRAFLDYLKSKNYNNYTIYGYTSGSTDIRISESEIKPTTPTQPSTQPTERKTYSGKVTSLQPNQIFVFGSNEGSSKGGKPTHGSGGAKLAKEKFGAIQGQSRGLQGQSYAIVTKKFYDVEKSSTPEEIIKEIKNLYEFARQNPTKEFLVSDYSESNLNGYSGQEMADMFVNAGTIPSNIVFNENFDKLIPTQPTTEETILKDGNVYNKKQINSKMLEKMGYSPAEIGKILKEICG